MQTLKNVLLNQFHYGVVSMRDGLETENSCAFYLDNLSQIGFAARSVGLQSLERVYWEIFQITTLSSSKQSTLTHTHSHSHTMYTVQRL